MIYRFPDLHTFRLAVTTGAVSPKMSQRAVQVAFDSASASGTGGFTLEPVGKASGPLSTELKKLGVEAVPEHVGEPTSLQCWAQVLPVEKQSGPPTLTANAPVMFEIPDVEQLPIFVGEMLRLGNDRQSYRWLLPETGGEPRVLLRVLGPPYYTLLRALDENLAGLEGEPEKRVRAYYEQAPHVWVEVGHVHPLGERLKPPPKQMVMLRAPREWTFLEDAPFQEIYKILEFVLPGSTIEWEEKPLTSKLEVPLRLVPGNAADVPELWVLRQDGVNQLDELVRSADESLMKRLSFAVAQNGEEGPTILVRVRPSKTKQSPPALEFEGAVCFKPFWKLPNLFLPCGTRLLPTLRRERIRELLADDPSELVWLFPDGEGRFTPEVLPDEAFRPLEDWIEYVIDHERGPLASWIGATQFDFESFICPEENTRKSKGSGGPGKGKKPKNERDEADQSDQEKGRRKKGDGSEREFREEMAFADLDEFSDAPVMATEPTELKIRLEELEKEFVEQEGPLDSPERLALWPQLARTNAELKETTDAAICWTNGIWERHPTPRDWTAGWVRAEIGRAPRDLPAEELDRQMNQTSPTPGQVRALASEVVWGAIQEPPPSGLLNRLSPLQQFFEKHEPLMSIRSSWLVGTHLARLAGNDVLGLARVRDRLLQRLFEQGLDAERDLPTFLRFAGLRDSDRMRQVRDQVGSIHNLALKWNGNDDSTKINRPYIDLLFAYGLARLGESTPARELYNKAKQDLEKVRDTKDGKPDQVHAFLCAAFEYRIEQAVAGKAPTGPLSDALHNRRDRLNDMAKYIVDRMRNQSRILEPQEKFDPYRHWKKQSDDLLRDLAELPDIKESAKLRDRINRLIRSGSRGKQSPEVQVHVLSEALPLTPRVNEEFTLDLLKLVPETLEASAKLTEPLMLERQGLLLERALFLAAHFDRVDQVQTLVKQFMRLMKGKSGRQLNEAIERIAGECLRSLRKLGLRDQIHTLLEEMRELVVQGRSLKQLMDKSGASWPEVLRTLLYLASGWLYFGLTDQAMSILDAARLELFREEGNGPKISPQEYERLARVYANVLGQAPVEMALGRIEELFRRMRPLPNTFTTATHFSRFHFTIVEEVVRSVVSEDFALGPTARRWLDDDEYLVRRRIHRDMRTMMAAV